MQPPYTHQAYEQYPSTPSHNSGSGYPSHPGVTDYMTPDFARRAAPSCNAQSYTTQDIFKDQAAIRTGPGYGPCLAVVGSGGTSAPQPLQNSDHSVPTIPYGNLRQGAPYHAGYPFDTEQVPGPTMSLSPHLPEADPNQDLFHSTCLVSQAEVDKINLTYGNDGHGGPISGHGSNRAMAGGTSGTTAPQPLKNGDYAMPSIPYSNLRQGEPYYAGSHCGTGQAPGPTMSSSSRLPVAGSSQDASHKWRFHTCWVSHSEDDEIHLTIALKKS